MYDFIYGLLYEPTKLYHGGDVYHMKNKNNFNSSICQTKGSNTEKIKFVNNF